MRKIYLFIVALLAVSCISCQKTQHPLQVELEQYINTCPAKIGVAVILPDSDIIVVNDGHYPMNSVVKLYQDLPSAQALIMRNKHMHDSVWIRSTDLDDQVYSPMRDELKDGFAPLSWQDLFEYAVSKSDNNASDLLFKILEPIDSVITYWNNKGIEDFDIKWGQAEIYQDPSRGQENWTTPLAAARVINYTAPMSMISSNYEIATAGGVLMHCQTGENRISKPLKDTNAMVFHKTGTGFNDDEGNPTSISDVAYILLPSGKVYTLAVFVKDSKVGMDQTEAMIAHISEMVFDYISEEEASQK